MDATIAYAVNSGFFLGNLMGDVDTRHRALRAGCQTLAILQLAIAAFMPRIGLPTKPWENALGVTFYSSALVVPVLLSIAAIVRAARRKEKRGNLIVRALFQLIVALIITGAAPWFFSVVESAHNAFGPSVVHSSLAQTPQAFVILGILSNIVTCAIFAPEDRTTR